MLIAARVVQGVGAALMNPATLSIITVTFPPRQRGTAIGIWAGVSALALAIGPLVGGLITEHINWNWIFFINVPVGVARDRRRAPRSSTSRATRRTSSGPTARPAHVRDRPVRAHVRADRGEQLRLDARRGSSAPSRSRPSRSSAFVLLERHQRLPMLDLVPVQEPHVRRREHRDAAVGARDVRRLLLRLALHAEHPRLLADAGGRGVPADDGADHPASRRIAGRLSDRFGSRWLVGGGHALLVAVSLLLFSRLGADATFWTLLPAMLIGGVGMAMTMTPTTAAAMGAVPHDKAGVGSAVLNSARQVGGSLGIAIIGRDRRRRHVERADAGDAPARRSSTASTTALAGRPR